MEPASFHPLQVTIRRERVLEDAFAQLSARGPGLKRRLAVTFINEQASYTAGFSSLFVDPFKSHTWAF